jgi:glycerol-3-phosphate cytidylyltransferase
MKPSPAFVEIDMYKIGLTASAFDLLHAGHIAMLKEAKNHCDYLICALHIDPSKERKYKNKPIQTVVERYVQLKAVSCVDQIVPYETEDDLLDILNLFNVNIRIIGEEYIGKSYTGYELQMETHFNKRRHRFSSSELRSRIFDREKKRRQD